MRSTIRDVYGSLTIKNAAILGAIVGSSVILIEVLGYLIWRRFPIPSLIIFSAAIVWKIARRIGHDGLSRVFNAASVGVGSFGIALFVGAIIDGALFPEYGYVSWSVTMSLWAWISFHAYRAWRILKAMTPDRLLHVTGGTGKIFAQMTYREARAHEALDAYKEATKFVVV